MSKTLICLLALLPVLVGCLPFGSGGGFIFRDYKQEQIIALTQKMEKSRQAEAERLAFLEDKRKSMEEIIVEANASFEEIKPIIQKKCFDCHDTNTRLKFYARILPRLNPLYKHQVEGLKAIDFVDTFPLKAQGAPPQLALLKSIRNQVIDRTMPLKSYRLVYRNRRVFNSDEEKILAWTDPLIHKLEEYNEKFENPANDPALLARTTLELKCFRCHANGNDKGGFGDMEDTKKLLASKYVNFKNPENSALFTIADKGQMPPNKREALTEKELFDLKEWLIIESKKEPIK